MALQDTELDLVERPYPSAGSFRDPITGLFPPLAGADGADDEDDTTDDDAEDTTGDDADTEDDAAPADDADLDTWKGYARKHEGRAKKTAKELDRERKARERAEKALRDREEADKSEAERERDKAVEDAKAEARREAIPRLVKAEIRAQAAGRFANPKNAVKLIDVELTELVDDDGEPDEDAIRDALDDLLEDEPHLAAGSTTGGKGDPDAGKGKGRRKSVEDMTPDEHLAAIRRHQ